MSTPLCSFWHAVCLSCIPLGEMLDIDDLSPRATMWNWSVVAARLMVCGVGHNEALDRTMSAMGKILIDHVNGKAISDIDGKMWSMRCFFGESMCQLFLC